VIQSRFYNVNGIRLEARFFNKGELYPETDTQVPKQGIWGRSSGSDWDSAVFLGGSWRFIRLDSDVLHLPDRK
jgi:hypothetical protein